MATYYVNPTTGSNSNSGAAGQQWQTIEHAAANSTAGDTIHLEAGDYTMSSRATINGQTFIGDGKNLVNITVSGGMFQRDSPFFTVGNACLYMTGSNSTFQYASFDGQGKQAGQCVAIFDADNFLLDQVDIRNFYASAVWTLRCNNGEVRDVYSYNNSSGGSGYAVGAINYGACTDVVFRRVISTEIETQGPGHGTWLLGGGNAFKCIGADNGPITRVSWIDCEGRVPPIGTWRGDGVPNISIEYESTEVIDCLIQGGYYDATMSLVGYGTDNSNFNNTMANPTVRCIGVTCINNPGSGYAVEAGLHNMTFDGCYLYSPAGGYVIAHWEAYIVYNFNLSNCIIRGHGAGYPQGLLMFSNGLTGTASHCTFIIQGVPTSVIAIREDNGVYVSDGTLDYTFENCIISRTEPAAGGVGYPASDTFIYNNYAGYSVNATIRRRTNIIHNFPTSSSGPVSVVEDSGTITADPQFTFSGAVPWEYYSLSAGSPGLGAATDGGNIGASQGGGTVTNPTLSIQAANVSSLNSTQWQVQITVVGNNYADGLLNVQYDTIPVAQQQIVGNQVSFTLGPFLKADPPTNHTVYVEYANEQAYNDSVTFQSLALSTFGIDSIQVLPESSAVDAKLSPNDVVLWQNNNLPAPQNTTASIQWRINGAPGFSTVRDGIVISGNPQSEVIAGFATNPTYFAFPIPGFYRTRMQWVSEGVTNTTAEVTYFKYVPFDFFNITDVRETSVTMEWNYNFYDPGALGAGSDGVNFKYVVQRRLQGGGSWTSVKTQNGIDKQHTYSYTDNNIVGGNTYEYRVGVYYDDGVNIDSVYFPDGAAGVRTAVIPGGGGSSNEIVGGYYNFFIISGGVVSGGGINPLNPFSPALAGYPGLRGFANTRGAFTSTQPSVYRVTNLNNSGAGSFRDALAQGDDTLIIFDVSGTINLTGSYPNVTGNRITIAGETAPFPGIYVHGNIWFDSTDDVIMRHMRFSSNNALYPDSVSLSGCNRVLIDHCSIAYGYDELLEIMSSNYVTIQDSLLYNPVKTSSEDAKGIISDNTTFLSIIGNVMIHGEERGGGIHWGSGPHYFANNHVYNYTRMWQHGSFYDPVRAAVVANWFKEGPAGVLSEGVPILGRNSDGDWNDSEEIYLALNMFNGSVPADQSTLLAEWGSGLVYQNGSYGNITIPGLENENYSELLYAIAATPTTLNKKGARPTERVTAENVAINDLLNGTGTFPTASGTSPLAGVIPTLVSNTGTFDLGAYEITSNGYNSWEEKLFAAHDALLP